MVSFEDKGLVPPGASRAARSSGAATHTPGPWRVDPTAWGDIQTVGGREICSVFSAEDKGRILRIGGGGSTLVPDAQCVPNARLIAAAPDLLAALQRLLRTAEEELHDPEHAGGVREAKAAIAKATGQEVTTERDELAREGPASK